MSELNCTDNMDNKVCDNCDNKIGRESYLECNGHCKHLFHSKCLSIAAKDCNIAKNISGFKWFCENCEKYLEFCMEVKTEMENFKESVMAELNCMKIELQKSNKDLVAPQTINKFSYASVASVVQNKGEVLLIKPKNTKQESSTTKEDITNNLNPSAMEIGVTAIHPIHDGGILMKCKTKGEVKKLSEEAKATLGKKYDISIPKKKNPCFKITDIEEQMSDDELISCIKKQNLFLIHDNLELKLIVHKKMKTRYMAIFETDPTTWKRALDEGSLCIGWSTFCRVFDYVTTFRCFKCAGFNHKADDCKSKVSCFKCGATDHKKENCKSTIIKCLNCIEMNKNLKLSLDIEHSPFDASKCNVLQRKISNEKQKIKTVTE